MAKYAKFITAVLGAILAGVAVFFGFDLESKGISASSIMAMVVPFLTAIGVWGVPNDE